jgi:hypothetical protein
MTIKKIAFNVTEHMKICQAILGDSFYEIHGYMDGSGGFCHREKHGHNKEAEEEIKARYGNKGVEAFVLHLICDDIHRTYLQDKIIPEVKKRYKEIMEGRAEPPYFDKRDNLYCQEILQQAGSGADPQAKITAVLNKCESCGSKENLLLMNMNMICKDCLEKRGIIICAHCHNPVSVNYTVPDKVNGRHQICKKCARE